MRIVILGNNSGYGGAQTAFRKLCEFCSNDGHEIIAIALQSGHAVAPQIASSELIVVDAESRSLMAKARKWFRLVRAVVIARKFSPDVFVAVGLAKSASFIASHLGRRTFSVAQDFIYGRRMDDGLLLETVSSFDALAVQSPAMLPALKAQGMNSLPLNWLPCFPESPVVGVSHSSPSVASGVKLAYFGRLAPNKGLPMLITAFAAANLGADTTLHIWGEGEVRDELKQSIDANAIGDRVMLMGQYPFGDQAAKLMSAYHSLILPSTGSEGLPLILLEAMAYGIPFVATDVGAIRDCCAGNPDCIMVKPEVTTLISALTEMVARVQSGALDSDRLRLWYETHFSPDVMGARWREFLSAPKQFFKHD